MRARFLLLPALAMLVGCNAQPAQPTLAENEAAQRNEAADLEGADRMFGYPGEAVGRLNQFGFRLGEYAPAQGGYAASGSDITLSQSDAARPNTGSVAVTGPDARTIGEIVFTLSLTDDANAATAKKRLADIVQAFLFQYGIKDDGALDAIAAETDADGLISTIPATVAVEKGDDARRIVVTFRRPSASPSPEQAIQNTTQP